MLSANAFNLDLSRNLLFGKELNNKILHQVKFQGFAEEKCKIAKNLSFTGWKTL